MHQQPQVPTFIFAEEGEGLKWWTCGKFHTFQLPVLFLRGSGPLGPHVHSSFAIRSHRPPGPHTMWALLCCSCTWIPWPHPQLPSCWLPYCIIQNGCPRPWACPDLQAASCCTALPTRTGTRSGIWRRAVRCGSLRDPGCCCSQWRVAAEWKPRGCKLTPHRLHRAHGIPAGQSCSQVVLIPFFMHHKSSIIIFSGYKIKST